jgi:hypothetical protein
MRPRVKRLIFIAPLALIGMTLFIFIGATLVMHLWNWLVPHLFELPRITFWQALALLALCRILFGGLGLHGGGRCRMRNRYEHMSPEEREKFRHGVHERYGAMDGSSPEPKK